MTKRLGRRILLAGAAALFGAAMTLGGFALQRHQLGLAMQQQSVEPILDPVRNITISACLPILKLADQFGDYGFAVFLGLLLINVAAWASVIYFPVRLLASKAFAHD